jgi:hypothetical protein
LIAIGLALPTQGASLDEILKPASGQVLYVCAAKGNNSNPGSQDKPLKNIDKAVKKAKAGDTIAVCQGVYSGTFGIGTLELDKPVKLYGSFAQDFTSRSLAKTATLFQPDNTSGAKSRKPLVSFKSAVDGAVIDGFVFDMGMRNSYHKSEGKPDGVETGMLLLPPEKASGDKPTVTEPCLKIPSAAKAGDLIIRNNVFSNCAQGGILAGIRGGKYSVTNNVFVANRMRAIEIFGTCPNKGGPKAQTRCGEVEIAHNTILFTWSRLKDFGDMGYGVRVMTKAAFNIHDNLIGTAVLAGVDHTRFNNNEWIQLDNNVFFVNKTADLEYSPESNTKLTLRADQFGDLELASVQGNKTEVPKTFPVHQKYLAGFLAARYTEQTDYNPDSPANQLRAAVGLNKQGKISSQVSMFANRYPVADALKLFGALPGAGAQAAQ